MEVDVAADMSADVAFMAHLLTSPFWTGPLSWALFSAYKKLHELFSAHKNFCPSNFAHFLAHISESSIIEMTAY
jgi:hypothetical protein